MPSKVGVISEHSAIHELADHVEIECIKNGKSISYQEIRSLIGLSNEEDYTDGVAENR